MRFATPGYPIESLRDRGASRRVFFGIDPDSDCDPDTDSGAALRPEEVASPQGDEDVATPIGRSFGEGDEDFAVSMPLNAEE